MKRPGYDRGTKWAQTGVLTCMYRDGLKGPRAENATAIWNLSQDEPYFWFKQQAAESLHALINHCKKLYRLYLAQHACGLAGNIKYRVRRQLWDSDIMKISLFLVHERLDYHGGGFYPPHPSSFCKSISLCSCIFSTACDAMCIMHFGIISNSTSSKVLPKV